MNVEYLYIYRLRDLGLVYGNMTNVGIPAPNPSTGAHGPYRLRAATGLKAEAG